MNKQKPLVSICCITYNHEKYIRDSIEGFLMQETTFPVEILINDDASPDKTSDIIKEYEEKYPNLIFPIYQKENQYSKGIKPNPTFNYPRARGKYIALCEGDDYWTDPFKLQKQVDFLEGNPEYVLTGHDAKIIDETGNVIKESKLSDAFKRDASSEELKKGFWVLTLSMCFKNVTKELPLSNFKVVNGDTVLTCLLGNYGKFKYLPDINPAVYRIHDNGIWSKLSPLRKKKAKVNTLYALKSHYRELKDRKTELFYYYNYLSFLFDIIRRYIEEGQFKNFIKIYPQVFLSLKYYDIRWFLRTHFYIGWFILKYIAKKDK